MKMKLWRVFKMKIDVDYLKSILDKFIESKNQYINTQIFNSLLCDEYIEKFSFHWDILLDKNLILFSNDNLAKFIKRDSQGNITINHQAVRLNDFGYKFYEALKEKEFLNKIKSNFKNISMDTLFKIANKFLENKVMDF